MRTPAAPAGAVTTRWRVSLLPLADVPPGPGVPQLGDFERVRPYNAGLGTSWPVPTRVKTREAQEALTP